jgi:hypothetical protein
LAWTTVVGTAKPGMQAFDVSVRFEHLASPTFSINTAHLRRRRLCEHVCPPVHESFQSDAMYVELRLRNLGFVDASDWMTASEHSWHDVKGR